MRKTDYDSRLLIYRSRQASLIFLITIMTIGFTVLIMGGQEEGLEWYQIGLPLAGLGFLIILFPLTEEWEYRAWQGKPRKVEQNFDR